MGDMTLHFSRAEFVCPCCQVEGISLKLVDMLETARIELNRAILINSGYRCRDRNLFVEGSENSSHLTGEAVDIRCDNSLDRWNLMRILPAYFLRIGVGETFIHVDISEDKDQRVMWDYYAE